MKISAYIIDDEPIYIEILRKILVNNFHQINLLGFANNLEKGLLDINRLNPNLLFLDVNVGESEIFEIVRNFQSESYIIFVSSNEKYAIRAFRFDAIDFLLKPIDKDICISAINKALNRFLLQNNQEAKNSWTNNVLSISYLDRVELIYVDELLYCNSDGRYTIFHLLDGRELVASRYLREFDWFFDKHSHFFRISRSHIVNFKFVSKIIKKDGLQCVFKNGAILGVARRKFSELNNYLNSISVLNS